MEPEGRLCQSNCLSVALTAGRNQLSHSLASAPALLPTMVCGRRQKLMAHWAIILQKKTLQVVCLAATSGFIVMVQYVVLQ